MDKPTAGLRKRQQIKRANKLMLLWIAGVSVIVGVSVVLILFLIQRIIFDEKVISEKNTTVSVLEKNIKAVDDLKENIRVLETNDALKSVRLDDSASPIQSVLDALPADANSTALASSLQAKLLVGVPGVVIETLSVESSSDTDSKTGTGEIPFAFAISVEKGNYASLREILEKLEKSIRPFKVGNIVVEGQGNKVVMTVKGISNYEPAKTVQLKEKVVKP